MLDIKKRNYDVRSFVHNIEQWMIDTLKHFNIKGERRKERVGVWVVDNRGVEKKIGSLGIRISRGVSLHGLSLNIKP